MFTVIAFWTAIAYLIVMSLITTTKNFAGSLIFKVIPFVTGVALLVAVLAHFEVFHLPAGW